jgi:hypothetical protein
MSSTVFIISKNNEQGVLTAEMAKKALDWFRAHDFIVGMTDSQDAIYARLTRPDAKPTWPFFVRKSTGKLETSLQYLKDNPAFADEGVRLALLEKIKSLPGVVITTSKSTGWPAIPLGLLAKREVWIGFTQVANEVATVNDATNPPPAAGP